MEKYGLEVIDDVVPANDGWMEFAGLSGWRSEPLPKNVTHEDLLARAL